MSQVVFDISGPEDFRARVLDVRDDVAVAVDFWAPWCGPCQALGPTLERVILSLAGRMILAKVNTDEHADLAAQFGIRGIPAVKIFRGGQIVGEFTGALPEPQVRAALLAALPSEADELVARGDALRAGGDPAGAEADWRQALALDPRHGGARLRLGRMELEQGRADAARELLRDIPPGTPEYAEAEGLSARLEFAAACAAPGGAAAVRRRLEAEPENLELRYELGLGLAAAGQYPEALEAFLAVLEKDRKFRDGAAREAMLKIFSIVGPRTPLAEDYRAKLSRVLFA